ncbi:MAG: thioredoxin domain-containing protein, partial [Bacteroidota bacterium]
RALGEDAYREKAERAATFIWENLRQEDGRLDRNFKGGASAINAFLDDYGLLAQAYIDLYQISFAEEWLQRAEDILTYANAHFYEEQTGLYNYTSDLDPPLISGKVPINDQAIPSGNSVVASALHQLGILTANEDMLSRARNMMALLQPKLASNGPRFYANWGLLYLELMEPTYEVAILGAAAGAKRDELSKEYLPNTLFLGGEEEGGLALLTNKLNPGETTIYVCLEKVCQLPVTESSAALDQIMAGF